VSFAGFLINHYEFLVSAALRLATSEQAVIPSPEGGQASTGHCGYTDYPTLKPQP